MGSRAGSGSQREARPRSASARADERNASATIDDMLRRARASHERGALPDAERGYREVLGVDPDHADAWHLLGVLHFQHGRLDDADAAIARSIARAPSALALANHASVLVGLGRRDEALERLDHALTLNPAHLRALLLRAGVLADLGQHAEAVVAYDRLLDHAPTLIEALWRQAAALHALQRHADALHACDRALAVDRRAFDVHRQRARILRDLRRFDEALEHYAHALAVMPNSAEMLLMQGLTLADLGRLDQALASLNEAIAGQPDFIDALYNSAVMLERIGRYADALARCDRVLALDAAHAGALANRGNALFGLARYPEALASYDASLDVAPRFIEVLCNRARTLTRMRRETEALASCDRAIEIDAGYALAWFTRARILQRLHCYADALAGYDRVLAIDAADQLAHYQRGNVLRSMMRHDEALMAYDRVVALDPENIAANFTKAFVYLQMGDFERGWPAYEWRWREDQVGAHKRAFAQPLWLGNEPIDGRTILLHAEQGLGDTLHFCRYAKFVKALGAHVVIEVQGALKSVLAEVEGVDEVVGHGEPLPPFDVHCPLLSLPLVFRTDHASIPSDVPYLRARPERIATWQATLGERTRPRVGIAWSGNPNHLDDHNRSILLEHLLPLLTDDVEWISLQKVVRDEDRPALDASPIRHFGDALGSFADTAALMACVDCIVSVDTSVVHLAGALGRPLWVMLPFLPDWRWLLDRDDSPWYPTARLFRQSRAGEWGDVFERIGAALTSLPNAVPAAMPT